MRSKYSLTTERLEKYTFTFTEENILSAIEQAVLREHPSLEAGFLSSELDISSSGVLREGTVIVEVRQIDNKED